MTKYGDGARTGRAFPRFPTDLDIVVEVVGKNLKKIRNSCDKGRARSSRRKSTFKAINRCVLFKVRNFAEKKWGKKMESLLKNRISCSF